MSYLWLVNNSQSLLIPPEASRGVCVHLNRLRLILYAVSRFMWCNKVTILGLARVCQYLAERSDVFQQALFS